MPTPGGFNWFPASGVAGFLVLQDVGGSPRVARPLGAAAGVGAAWRDGLWGAGASPQLREPHCSRSHTTSRLLALQWVRGGCELSRHGLKLAHVVSRYRTTADRAMLQLDSPQHETRVPIYVGGPDLPRPPLWWVWDSWWRLRLQLPCVWLDNMSRGFEAVRISLSPLCCQRFWTGNPPTGMTVLFETLGTRPTAVLETCPRRRTS